MLLSKRQFLSHAAAIGALPMASPLLRAAEAIANDPPELNKERPLYDLIERSRLPRFFLDVDATEQKGKLVLKGNKKLKDSPLGAIIEIPAGANVSLKRLSLSVRPSWGYREGARLILQGAEGKRPHLRTREDKGLISLGNPAKTKLSLELENLNIMAGMKGDAVRAAQVHFLGLRDVKIEGGKNGISLSSLPTTIAITGTHVSHSGRGNGLTHGFYGGYNKRVIMRDSQFHSIRAPGHTFKCYAAHMDIQNCTFASWLEPADRDEGFSSELPPVDLGAWSQSLFIGNTIIRRGPARGSALEYRNRQYAKGAFDYIPNNWGTDHVDPSLVDNRTFENPYLFHHILSHNHFINGVLPDGSLDPSIKMNPGIAVRNNGTAPWASGGKTSPLALSKRPSSWEKYNERAIVWAHANQFSGIPFSKQYESTPYEQAGGHAPIRIVDELPNALREKFSL